MIEPLNRDGVHPKTHMYTVCSEAVRNRVNQSLGEWVDPRLRVEAPSRPLNSQYAYYLGEMGNAALGHALSVGTDPDDFESIELDKALSVVDELQLAFPGSSKTLKIWDVASPFNKIKAGKVPQIDRSTVEAAVGAYLALPYRCRAMDRLLVRILIGMEFYTFGGETKRRHLIPYFLGDIVVHAVFFGGIALLASWLSANGWISSTTAGWTAGICLSLFLLLTAINAVQLPFEWTKQAIGIHGEAPGRHGFPGCRIATTGILRGNAGGCLIYYSV
jgi:hypothetical protein